MPTFQLSASQQNNDAKKWSTQRTMVGTVSFRPTDIIFWNTKLGAQFKFDEATFQVRLINTSGNAVSGWKNCKKKWGQTSTKVTLGTFTYKRAFALETKVWAYQGPFRVNSFYVDWHANLHYTG